MNPEHIKCIKAIELLCSMFPDVQFIDIIQELMKTEFNFDTNTINDFLCINECNNNNNNNNNNHNYRDENNDNSNDWDINDNNKDDEDDDDDVNQNNNMNDYILARQLQKREDEAQQQEKQEKQRMEDLSLQFLQKEMQEKQNALENKEYDCIICADTLTLSRMYVLDGCNHMICKSCLSIYINDKIENSPMRRTITCCLCPQLISLNDFKNILSLVQYNRYLDLLVKDSLANDEAIKYCPKCETPMEVPSIDVKMITCVNNTCELSFCTDCKIPWHSDLSCDEYKEIKSADPSLLTIRKTTKKCPHCSRPIEKNKGCNKITCICKEQFCWICGDKYQNEHFNNGRCSQFD